MNGSSTKKNLIIAPRRKESRVKGIITWDQMTDKQKEEARKLVEHWDEIWNKPDDEEEDDI